MKFKDKSLARIYSFKFLYFLLFEKGFETIEQQQEDLASMLETFTDSLQKEEQEEQGFYNTEKSLFFSKQIIESAIRQRADIETLLSKHSKSKCNKIENALIYSALAESFCFADTPKNVIINEYIELGKKFGTKSTASFLNAFLDKAITK